MGYIDTSLYEEDAISSLILQGDITEALRGQVTYTNHTARKEDNQNSNSDSLAPECLIIILILFCFLGSG